jgi:ketosteroid isomerase-like protein
MGRRSRKRRPVPHIRRTGDGEMNQAVPLLRRMFGVGQDGDGVFDAAGQRSDAFDDAFDLVHPDACYSLFGPSGTKELLVGRSAIATFVRDCLAALSAHEDEILAILPIDNQCALVHARAYRQSAANGEALQYEWAMLYRVEAGLITYGADMLDAAAQAFWGRVRLPGAVI